MKKKEENLFFDIWRKLYHLGLEEKMFSFIENLASMLSAGVGILEALNEIKGGFFSGRMQKIVQSVYNDIAEGENFAGALRKVGYFDNYMVSMVDLGEKTGELPKILKFIISFKERENVFRSKINSALLYATIVFSITVLVGGFSSLYTLPRIVGMYSEFGQNPPEITKIVISIGKFLADYGFFFVPFLISLIVGAFYFLFSFPKTKFIGHAILFKIPFIKKLIKEVEVSRFCYLLGTMLEAGLPISGCLEVMPETTTFSNYADFYRNLYSRVQEGTSFGQSFKEYKNIDKLFAFDVRQILFIAESSGRLSSSLVELSKTYDNKAEGTARNLPIMVEPLLLVFISGIVILFVLATMVPIYNLVSIIE